MANDEDRPSAGTRPVQIGADAAARSYGSTARDRGRERDERGRLKDAPEERHIEVVTRRLIYDTPGEAPIPIGTTLRVHDVTARAWLRSGIIRHPDAADHEEVGPHIRRPAYPADPPRAPDMPPPADPQSQQQQTPQG